MGQPAMTNDAKLGLVLGVTIVLVIALVFFRGDPAVARRHDDSGRPITALPQVPATQISASTVRQ